VVSRYRKNISGTAPEERFAAWDCQINQKNGGDLIPADSGGKSMFFSVGIESPANSETAYGISVPAFDRFDYGCVSAADEQSDIAVMAREAILTVVEEMLLSGKHSVEDITDAGFMVYSANADYAHCDYWVMIDVDLSAFEGKQQRLNITLPDVLVKRIDGFIQGNKAVYKDRSHFLAQAARHELSQTRR
jgi:hypothetical protein